MLHSFFFSLGFFRFCQSGFYLDFFIKKLTELFTRNTLIYAAHFFGEKYIIEYLTKKIFDKQIFYFNKKFGLMNFFFSTLFIQTLSFFFYACSFLLIVVSF